MKIRLFACLLLWFAALVGAAPPSANERIAAFSVLMEVPPDPASERWQAAGRIAFKDIETEVFKLNVPDEAMAWVPQSGPCGGPGSPLMIAFFASLMKDHLTGQVDGTIYRAWGTVIRHYRYFLTMPINPDDPENTFPTIPAIEAMIKQDAEGTLKAEAAKLEQKSKNSAPATPSR